LGWPKGRASYSLAEEGRLRRRVVESPGWGWHEKEQASQPVQREHQRLEMGWVSMEDLSQGQAYWFWVEGFAMKKEG